VALEVVSATIDNTWLEVLPLPVMLITWSLIWRKGVSAGQWFVPCIYRLTLCCSVRFRARIMIV